MAKLCATIIALFCIFTLAVARSAPENDGVAADDQSNSVAAVTSVPLTRLTFRPVNRRFPMRSRHPCRHHFRVSPLGKQNERISYGNDMIASSGGENGDFEDPVRHGGEVRRIPGRWMRLHHHHHHQHYDDDADDRMHETVFRRYDSDGLDWEKKALKKMREHFRPRNAAEEVDEHEDENENEKVDFMKRVHDFVDHYFPHVFG